MSWHLLYTKKVSRVIGDADTLECRYPLSVEEFSEVGRQMAITEGQRVWIRIRVGFAGIVVGWPMIGWIEDLPVQN